MAPAIHTPPLLAHSEPGKARPSDKTGASPSPAALCSHHHRSPRQRSRPQHAHHRPLDPIVASPRLSRRAASVRSFPPSFLNPGCTGFTQPDPHAPRPSTLRHYPHTSPPILYALRPLHSARCPLPGPAHLPADDIRRRSNRVSCLYLESACFVSLALCSPS